MSGRAILSCTLLAVLLIAAGCVNPLSQPQPVHRANLGTEPLSPQTQPASQTTGVTTSMPPSGMMPQVVGTYTFTIPPTVTQFKKTVGTTVQYLLYNGQPTADQTPFMTITVAPDVQQTTAGDPNFQIQNQRTYTLNGLAAQEWTGYTVDKAPFTEIILTNLSGGGSKLDALAVATDEQTRELALSILQSIQWQAAQNQ